MAENTAISWCDHTINFWWGCEKVSQACANCYAEALDARFHPADGAVRCDKWGNFSEERPHWGHDAPRLERVDAAEEEALRYERRAVKEGRRFRVFTNSMSDFFEDRRDLDAARLEALETIWSTPHLDWLILTKRPEKILSLLGRAQKMAHEEALTPRLAENALTEWLGWWLAGKAPANVWLGTTVEDQERSDQRIPALLGVPAAVRFLSCEPLLGTVDLRLEDCWLGYTPTKQLLHWVICGGESGRKARPMHPDWARGLRDQCAAAGVPFHFKQWGEWGSTAQRMDTGEAVFRVFRDYEHWCSKGPTWMRKGDTIMDASGKQCFCGGDIRDGSAPFTALGKVGKKAAGRLLDGVEHNAFPEVR